MKKKMIISAAITAAAILAVVEVADHRWKTAVVSSELQEHASVEVKFEPIPEMVTLTEPEQSEITPAEPFTESEQPIQETESKPTGTPDEPQEQPSNTPITLPEIPKEKPKQPTPAQPKAPKNGDTKNGQIYIEGFGWVEDHGGGGSGTVDTQMYQNGNKIGKFG